MARELARRLYQRNSMIPQPNDAPKLFIISSSEAIATAEALRAGLEKDVFSTVWKEGVFFAGGVHVRDIMEIVRHARAFARSNSPCLPCLSYQRRCEQDFRTARVLQAAGASVSTTAPFQNGPIEPVLPVETGAL